MTMTVRPLLGSSVGTAARSATGWSNTRTRPPAAASSEPAFQRAAPSCSPTKRPTTAACILTMVRFAMPCTSGPAMTMATAYAKSTVTPVKALGLPCEPTCAFFGVFINTTWPSMWRPLRRCSTPRLFRPLLSGVCALVTICTLETHEPTNTDAYIAQRASLVLQKWTIPPAEFHKNKPRKTLFSLWSKK